jgi:coronin-1B/1C/6
LDKGNFHDLLLKFQRGFRTFWRGKDNKIITVGYSKQSDRQVQLYDLKNLDKPLDSVKSDNAASTVFPHFDETINILYLCGRSDSTIRLFEIGEDYIEFLTSHRF